MKRRFLQIIQLGSTNYLFNSKKGILIILLIDLSSIDRFIRSLDKKNKGRLILFQLRSERTDHILLLAYF
jgi:hypothetical protein